MTTTCKYPPGLVVRYTPDPSRHSPNWCREGYAIADSRGLLVDTYWGTGNQAHLVNEAERPSVTVLFHLDDYDELDRYRPDEQKWLTYAPEDRRRITMQHGLQQRLFIRKGARPHRDTILDGLREKVEKAEAALKWAQDSLLWAQEDLDAVLKAPEDCTCRPALCAGDECLACNGGDWRECKALPARLGGAR